MIPIESPSKLLSQEHPLKPAIFLFWEWFSWLLLCFPRTVNSLFLNNSVTKRLSRGSRQIRTERWWILILKLDHSTKEPNWCTQMKLLLPPLKTAEIKPRTIWSLSKRPTPFRSPNFFEAVDDYLLDVPCCRPSWSLPHLSVCFTLLLGNTVYWWPL